jgi:hypothetical protein
MLTFVIIYYAFLILACCTAAYYKYRTALLLLFTLLCVSLISGLLFGANVLVNITIGVGCWLRRPDCHTASANRLFRCFRRRVQS